MDDFIREGILSNRELNFIKKELDAVKHKAVKAGVYSNSESRYHPESRSGVVYWPKTQEAPYSFNLLQSLVIELYSDVKRLDLSHISELQYVKYDTGDKFKKHRDIIPRPDEARLRGLTLSINLTPEDDYTDGELKVFAPQGEVALNRKAGSYIIFPAFYWHEAGVVTSGTREALVAWSYITRKEIEWLKQNAK